MRADIHSHILPGIDDGAPDIKTTQALLSALQKEKVTHLALTPHYYPYKKSQEDFVEDRQKAYESLMALPEAQAFTFSLGAEVYLTETLFNYEDFSPFCYQGTNLMLTELEYTKTFTASSRRRLMRLIHDYSITPVLAHIERFPFLRNLALLDELKRMGCLFQVNLTSFSSVFSRRRLCRYFAVGWIDFLGEDIHRTVLCGEERKNLFEHLSKRVPDLISVTDKNAMSLIFS